MGVKKLKFTGLLSTVAAIFLCLNGAACSESDHGSDPSVSKSKNNEVSADPGDSRKWAGPYSQGYMPDVRKPQGDLFNAKAQCQLDGKKDVVSLQQSSKGPADAIKRALYYCNARCSDTGYGGCTIVRQFVAKLLPRVDGQPFEGYVCKMTENKPLAEPVKNRPWPGPPGKTMTEAIEKGFEYADSKAGLDVQPVKCINNDYPKSETLVRGDDQSANG